MARILLVDDEPLFAMTTAELLRRKGHEVCDVRSGEAARQTAASFAPDVLVVDWMLGGDATGLDLAREMRRTSPALHVILITGYHSAELRAASRRAGVAAVLEKPFDAEELEATVRRCSVA